MKNLKKVLALVLAVVMIMSVVTVASAKTYKDVDSTNTYADAIDALSSLKILDGFKDGDSYSFKAEDPFTRAQAAKIVAIVHNAATNGKIKDQEAISGLYSNAQNPFVDCNTSWALPFINYCRITGLADGMTATTYEPNRYVTGVQFLKLMLTTLNFDTAKEGYTGTGWDVNVLNRANEVGLTAGLAKDWKAIAPIKRGEAAQVLYNALTKYLVEYGQKVKNNFAEWTYWTVDKDGKKVEKTDRNYLVYTESFITNEGVRASGTTLGEKMGITVTRMYDVFGRPGYMWKYKTWSRFYMDAPLASFRGTTSECDILVGAGIAKTSTDDMKFDYFDNGTLHANHDTYTHVGKVCEKADAYLGNTGSLLQVFAADDGKTYIITKIDTYLTKVTKVKDDAKHGNAGGSTELDVYAFNTFANTARKATVVGLYDYAKNSYVLVYPSWMTDAKVKGTAYEGKIYAGDAIVETSETATESHDVYTLTDNANFNAKYIVDVKVAESKDQKLTGRALNGKASLGADLVNFDECVADAGQLTVDGVKTNVALRYVLDENDVYQANIAVGGNTYTFFYDQYGNLIGDVKATSEINYAVVDGIVWITSGASYSDGQFASAGIVKAGENAITDVNVAKVGAKTATGVETSTGVVADAKVSTVKSENAQYASGDANHAYQHGVVKYTVNADGAYTLNYNVGAELADVKTIDSTNPFLKTGYIADENTVFTVKTKVAGKVVYTSYTGIKNVPSIKNIVCMVAIKEADSQFVDYVYIDATNSIFAGSTTVAFVSNKDVRYVEKDTFFTYYDLYINGEKTEINVPKTLVAGAGNAYDLFAHTGLYELNYNADGTQVIAVTELTPANYKMKTDITIDSVSGAVVKAHTTAGDASFNADGATIYFVYQNKFDHSIVEIKAMTVADLADFVTEDNVKVLYTYADAKADWVAETVYVFVEAD